jgi:hypothetical protein
MTCKAGVDVPATETEAKGRSGWSPIDGAMIADAPDWSLDRRCEADEVCAVYKHGRMVVARYCSQNQCSSYWAGPMKPCGTNVGEKS